MSTLQVVYVVVAVSVAALALVGAFVALRALSRTSKALQQASQRLSATAIGLPVRAANARSQLASVNDQAHKTLVALDDLDARMDRTGADLRATRAASDTLRVRLIEGRLTIARIRQLVRLLMRLGELRRDFL